MLQHPCPNGIATSPFGPRGKKMHNGLDFAAPPGTPVYAAKDGVVERAAENRSFGEVVVVRHSDGTATLYAHLSSYDVSYGQEVKSGQKLGAVGNTGEASRGNHLHFEYLQLPAGVKVSRDGSMGIDSRDYGIDPAPHLTDAKIPPSKEELDFFESFVASMKAAAQEYIAQLDQLLDEARNRFGMPVPMPDPAPAPGQGPAPVPEQPAPAPAPEQPAPPPPAPPPPPPEPPEDRRPGGPPEPPEQPPEPPEQPPEPPEQPPEPPEQPPEPPEQPPEPPEQPPEPPPKPPEPPEPPEPPTPGPTPPPDPPVPIPGPR